MKGLELYRDIKFHKPLSLLSPKRKVKVRDTTSKYKFLTRIVFRMAAIDLMGNLPIISEQLTKIISFRYDCNILYGRNGDKGHNNYISFLVKTFMKILKLAQNHSLKNRMLVRWAIDNMRY